MRYLYLNNNKKIVTNTKYQTTMKQVNPSLMKINCNRQSYPIFNIICFHLCWMPLEFTLKFLLISLFTNKSSSIFFSLVLFLFLKYLSYFLFITSFLFKLFNNCFPVPLYLFPNKKDQYFRSLNFIVYPINKTTIITISLNQELYTIKLK